MNEYNLHADAGLREEEAALWQGLWAFYTRVPSFLDTHLQAAYGINHAAFFTLRQVAAAEDSALRMSGLAERTFMSLSHLSRVVGRLEKKGWVTRVPDPSDGRATLAVVTSSGRDFLQAALPAYYQQIKEVLFDRLTSEEIRQVGTTLTKLATVVDPTSPQPDAPSTPITDEPAAVHP